MLFLAIAFLPHRVCGNSDKDDAVAVLLPPGFPYTTSGYPNLYTTALNLVCCPQVQHRVSLPTA